MFFLVGCLNIISILASSAESVGAFRLRKVSKVM
jgi:hypothetical protein